MEMRDRSSYPDSPRPGHGHPSGWIAKPYSIVFTGVVLFILIFGIAIFLGYRQFETTRHNVLTADKTTANLLANLILEHNKATIGILQSYAYRPLFIAAVKNKDLAGVHRHLSDLKKNAEIDLTFVTDKRGLLWANFPVFPEAVGKNLSNRDWYKGVSFHWKPYISTVFKLIVGDKPLAVAVCVPIFDEKGRPIGILGNSQRLGFIDDAIERVPFSPYTTVNVIDRAGKILYSNKFPYQESITDYRFFPILEPALKGKEQQIEMNDPRKDHEKSYLTIVPMGDIGWTVIIERSLKDIYRSDLRRFIEIGAISFLVFLLITFFLIYLRKAHLFRKTEELLHAEIKLRQREEALKKSTQLLRDTGEMAKVGGWELDLSTNEVLCTEEVVRIHGVEPGYKLKLEEALNFYAPESRPALEEVLKKAAETGEPYDLESLFIPSGSKDKIWVRSLGRAVYSGGKIVKLTGTFQNIDKYKRAEEALRASEERYHTVARLSSEFAYSCIHAGDDGYEVDWITDAFFTLTGYSEAELHEQRCWLFVSHPDDHEMAIKPLHELKAGESDTREFRIVTKGGRVLYIINHMECHVDPKAHGGLRLFGAVQDITERKQAEEALRESEENFRRSLDESPLGVRIVTEEGETVYANRAILDIYGYDSIEELNTTPIKKRYTPESYAEFKIRREKRKRGDYNPSEYDISIVRKDGEVHHLQVFRKDILWDGERQFQVIYQDITERKRVEEEKRRMEERSRKVVEDIFRFIPEGVLVFSRKMELLRQNQAFRELVSGYAGRLGFAEDELENLIIDKIKAAMGDENIKEIRISRKHETREQT